MKIVSKKAFLLVLCGAVLVTGCTKKPTRPDPSSTVLGPAAGGTLNPMDIATDASAAGLQQRDPNILEDENTIRGLLQPVYFDFDKSSIKQSERAKIEAAASYLKDNPQHRILFEGHCDWRGTAEYNLGLGDRRAGAARQFLSTLGVGTDKIETLSKGSLDAVKNADDAQMAKDRRAEIVILKK